MREQANATVMQNGKELEQSPWSYNESFIIAFTLIVLGFLVELVFQGQLVPAPHRPENLIILFASITFLALVHFFFRKAAIVKWFSSIPCAVSGIVSYAGLVLILGFIRQEGEGQPQWMQQLGLNHLKNSWPFLFIEVYLFVSLGMVVLRRAYPFTRKNFGFLLNHFGLWLTLMAVAMGAGDLQRLRVSIFENGDFLDKGVRTGHEIYNLPFSLKLLDFKMETYNPKIMLSDTMGGLPEKQKGEKLPLIEKGSEYKLNNYSITVLNILPSAARTDSGYVPSIEPMAAAAALVHVKNLVTGDSLTNWLCSGSRVMLPEYILLEKNLGLWLLSPEPKKYESEIVVKTRLGDIDTVTVEVNRPYKTKGWSFYQAGYEEKMGPASQLSIIEAVYDPWLPVVYTGIILMIAGAFYLFWLGRGLRSDK
jgi:hypothetical protein